ncbi:MAG: transcriptional repressor, partial [Bacteroidota bacterium]
MADRERYKEILKSHKLRVTDCRMEVLAFFHLETKTLSQSDLEHQFAKRYDPVTLYRTLNSFFEAGLIHK